VLPSPAAVTGASAMTQLRDVRYCEVIPSVQKGTTVSSYVYNTLGFNDCPPEQWSVLTADEVNQEYGSQSAQLNGPRHWTIDALSASGQRGNQPSGNSSTFPTRCSATRCGPTMQESRSFC
jgi:hypothetical protein